MNDKTTEILEERGKRYGRFSDHAEISQAIKLAMVLPTHGGTMLWAKLDPDQKEALEMIAHKIGRILNGDPNYIDNWDDIAGYARLVADRLRAYEEAFAQSISQLQHGDGDE